MHNFVLCYKTAGNGNVRNTRTKTSAAAVEVRMPYLIVVCIGDSDKGSTEHIGKEDWLICY